MLDGQETRYTISEWYHDLAQATYATRFEQEASRNEFGIIGSCSGRTSLLERTCKVFSLRGGVVERRSTATLCRLVLGWDAAESLSVGVQS